MAILKYDPRDRKQSTENHNKIINQINSKYGKGLLNKQQYWDAIDLEVDRFNNEQENWYEKEETPFDNDSALREGARIQQENGKRIFKSPLEQARADFDAGKISLGELDDVAIAEFEKNKRKLYKNPFSQAEGASNEPNAYDRARVLNFLENYGDFLTDNAYLDFAKAKGITPGKPDSNRGYYNEYIKNEDFLREVNDGMEKDNQWDDYEFAGIDDDYKRSYGPVTNGKQYDSYLKWKKEGN